MSRSRTEDVAEELFRPQVPQERWHPNFARVVDHDFPDRHAVVEGWAKGFRDRDGKFVKEFQTTFNSSFWELYLFAVFRDLGCRLDQDHIRPDFTIDGGPLGEFVAEAVVASNPAGGLPEWCWDPTAGKPDVELILDLASLRLSQAVMSKLRKWRDEYSTLPHTQDRPFIVCVCPFDQPRASLQGSEAIDRVLFGSPGPLVDVHEDELVVVGHTGFKEVFKPSGSAVELGLFTDDRAAEISAVIFSSLATWSKVSALSPGRGETDVFHAIGMSIDGSLINCVGRGKEHKETLVNGATLFLNPHAIRPLDPEPFFLTGFAVHSYSPGGTVVECRTDRLIQRTAYRLVERGMAPPKPTPPPGAKPHRRSFPPDGVPYGAPSSVGTVVTSIMEQYCGWTLIVGMDAVDSDWCAIAKRGRYLTHDEFRNTGCDESNEYMSSWFATRSNAVTAAQKYIDTQAPAGVVP